MSDFKPDIWRLQAQFDTRGLINALKSDDAGIRRRAAAALRALGAVDAVPELEAVLEAERDPETRSNILAALASLQQESERRAAATGELKEKEAVTETEKLVQQLRTGETEDLVIEAAHGLGNKGDKTAVVPLVMLFNDPRTAIKIRLAVAEALLKLESAPVEVALLGALRSDEWRVRRNAAAILGKLRAAWAVEPLSKLLDDKHDVTRKTAMAALRNVGTPEALDSLRAYRDKLRQQEEAAKAAPPPQTLHHKEDKTGFEEDTATKADLSSAAGDENNAYEMDVLDEIDDDTGPTTVEPPKREQPVDETQKIVWPKRARNKRKPANPTLAPTRPLDPSTLDRIQNKGDSDHDDQS